MTEIQGLESLAPAIEGLRIEEPEVEVPGEPALVADETHVELFDSKPYDVAPKIDGQSADKIVIRFGGSISFGASDAEGRALYEMLQLGADVELRVGGNVAAKNGTYKVNARDEEIVTGTAAIKVDTVYVMAPEDLS